VVKAVYVIVTGVLESSASTVYVVAVVTASAAVQSPLPAEAVGADVGADVGAAVGEDVGVPVVDGLALGVGAGSGPGAAQPARTWTERAATMTVDR